jgi:hypothetical protein
MKRLSGFGLLLVLFAAPAFASQNSATVDLTDSTKVGSTVLSAGSYKVTWTGSGSTVQVTLVQKGKTPVTVPATVVPEKNRLSSVTTSGQGDVVILQSIQLPSVSLVLATAPTTGQ